MMRWRRSNKTSSRAVWKCTTRICPGAPGYFDTIPHEKLMACVQRRIVDGSVLKLIRMWLKAVIVEQGKGPGDPPKYSRSKQGTPQGGVISPLLANLYLHWFDRMFHRYDGPYQWANARLVRYADDFVIMARFVGGRIEEFVESRRAGTGVAGSDDQPREDAHGEVERAGRKSGFSWVYVPVRPGSARQAVAILECVPVEKVGAA